MNTVRLATLNSLAQEIERIEKDIETISSIIYRLNNNGSNEIRIDLCENIGPDFSLYCGSKKLVKGFSLTRRALKKDLLILQAEFKKA